MTANTRTQSEAITQVEAFIKQLHDGDVIIDRKAQQLIISIPKKSSFWSSGSREDIGSLADLLGKALAKYQTFKSLSPEMLVIKERAAAELLDYIERARTHGVIIHQKLTSELNKTQEENIQLKEDIDKLRRENLRLQRLVEALHQTMDRIGLRRDTGEDHL